MAPKVSQGVTTVVAGNCGISLSPMPGGLSRTIPPPLDLLDDSRLLVPLSDFRCLRRGTPRPPRDGQLCAAGRATQPCAWRRWTVRSSRHCRGDRTHARTCARSACVRRDRRFHGSVLRIGQRGADRGSDRGVPAAEGVQGYLLHPHAQRSRAGDGFARRELSHRSRAGRAGGDLASQSSRHAESWAFETDAATHCRCDAQPVGVPRLLSVHRVVDDAERRPRRHLLAR